MRKERLKEMLSRARRINSAEIGALGMSSLLLRILEDKELCA